MDQASLIQNVIAGGTSGLIAGLVLLVGLLMTGKLVPGTTHKEVQSRLKRYEDLSFGTMAAMEKLAAVIAASDQLKGLVEKIDALVVRLDRQGGKL